MQEWSRGLDDPRHELCGSRHAIDDCRFVNDSFPPIADVRSSVSSQRCHGADDMHFHLPKPLHGWRALAGEVGIIVVGVLIALGAEQLVETIHKDSEARDARSEIEGEVVADITRIEQRAFAADCIDARLAEMDRIIDSAGEDGRINRPTWIGRPPRYAVETTRWDAASQSGRVSLLPSDWQAQFGFLYTTLRYHYQLNNEEEMVWSRLDALTGIDRVTTEVKFALKGDIAQAARLMAERNAAMSQVSPAPALR
jgi:hypothetical protein